MNEFPYHSSWDAIVQAVIKFNKICHDNGEELSNNSKKQEHLSNPLDNPNHWKSWSYHWINPSWDLKYVWNKLVNSIEWYNKNK